MTASDVKRFEMISGDVGGIVTWSAGGRLRRRCGISGGIRLAIAMSLSSETGLSRYTIWRGSQWNCLQSGRRDICVIDLLHIHRQCMLHNKSSSRKTYWEKAAKRVDCDRVEPRPKARDANCRYLERHSMKLQRQARCHIHGRFCRAHRFKRPCSSGRSFP